MFVANLDEKNSKHVSGGTDDLLEVHRRHIFCLGKWTGNAEKNYRNIKHFSSDIKFKENKNFLDAHIGSADGEPMAYLLVKPTDTYQYLDLNSSHAY